MPQCLLAVLHEFLNEERKKCKIPREFRDTGKTLVTADTNHQTAAHEIRPADAVVLLAVLAKAYEYCVDDHL